ncbi:uncharacterized protein LOC119662234 [Teleopsis dalmanni]|uniref:uncharacterized protein LOC119662234 n=1 Tax=Teleopsis dalmanni TaxID=139649 RepID=UPI0018CD1CD6|nr:uncharacterized protein LOC119662234 [Teleopsis dalmanni]
MGRNIKDHYGDSEKRMLKGFKEELRRHRKRQNELVRVLKNEIREYKKKHPNNINKNFERALKRLQKEDAEKKRWKFFPLFKWFRRNNNENMWSDSDSDQSELIENHCPANEEGKIRSTITSPEAIYCRSDFFEDSQDHEFKWIDDTNKARKGHKRIASEIEGNENQYCQCKSPKVIGKCPMVVTERSSCEKTNPENLSRCSRHSVPYSTECIGYLKDLNVMQIKENDSISAENAAIEKRVLRLRDANGESRILVVNMPQRLPLNCEIKKKDDGNEEPREKHRKKRKKNKKPES